MECKRPFVFIGSSSEGIAVAEAVQQNLDDSAECMIWNQGVFGLGGGTLASLLEGLPKLDFAILALTADDLVQSRGIEEKAPRDNVLLEAGIFLGGLGPDRTFLLLDRSDRIKLPSDLAGITVANFEPPTLGTWKSAVGSACTAIKDAMLIAGTRNANQQIALNASYKFGVDGVGVTIRVTNSTKDSLPPYELILRHPEGTWRFFREHSEGPQYSDQYRDHTWMLASMTQAESSNTDGLLHAFPATPVTLDNHEFRLRMEKRIAELDLDCFTLRLQMRDSEKVLLESNAVGFGIASYVASGVDGTHRTSNAEQRLTRACWRPEISVEELKASDW